MVERLPQKYPLSSNMQKLTLGQLFEIASVQVVQDCAWIAPTYRTSCNPSLAMVAPKAPTNLKQYTRSTNLMYELIAFFSSEVH